MGWYKDTIKCLSSCSIRVRMNCKSKCCSSNCMVEESGQQLSRYESSVEIKKDKSKSNEKISAV
jgi:hypothetical protein